MRRKGASQSKPDRACHSEKLKAPYAHGQLGRGVLSARDTWARSADGTDDRTAAWESGNSPPQSLAFSRTERYVKRRQVCSRRTEYTVLVIQLLIESFLGEIMSKPHHIRVSPGQNERDFILACTIGD